MKALTLEQAQSELMGQWRQLMCADRYPRIVRIEAVESDGDGGWYVSGLDSSGYRHSAYLRNDLSQGVQS